MAELYFETHATSDDNERGVASGHQDCALSPRGHEQARELGRRYRDAPLAAVVTSDLRRAIRTAEIAFAGRAVARSQDARLRECDYGDWTGCPTRDLEAVRLRHIRDPFPGGESYEAVVRRVQRFLHDVSAPPGEAVLVIGHRATWYALEHLLAGRPLAAVMAAPWQWQPGWRYRVDV